MDSVITSVPPVVHVLATGGTIAMVNDGSTGLSPALSAEDLLATLPELSGRVELRAESFRQRPGASLSLADLVALADRITELTAGGVGGVVITQGTDTLEETAYFLDLVVRAPEPIILTGAMRPAEAPGADGPANLHAAVVAASSLELRESGALVVIDDQIHSGARVRKVRTASTGAFSSPDTGPLGWVVEGRVHLLARRNDRLQPPPIDAHALRNAPVALIPIVLGGDSRVLDTIAQLGYAGVVVDAMGAGHVPAWLVDSLTDLAASLPVVLASRAGAGRVHTATYGFAGSETDLIARGLIPAGYLDGRRARLLLAVLLAGSVSRAEIATWFARA